MNCNLSGLTWREAIIDDDCCIKHTAEPVLCCAKSYHLVACEGSFNDSSYHKVKDFFKEIHNQNRQGDFTDIVAVIFNRLLPK